MTIYFYSLFYTYSFIGRWGLGISPDLVLLPFKNLRTKLKIELLRQFSQTNARIYFARVKNMITVALLLLSLF